MAVQEVVLPQGGHFRSLGGQLRSQERSTWASGESFRPKESHSGSNGTHFGSFESHFEPYGCHFVPPGQVSGVQGVTEAESDCH